MSTSRVFEVYPEVAERDEILRSLMAEYEPRLMSHGIIMIRRTNMNFTSSTIKSYTLIMQRTDGKVRYIKNVEGPIFMDAQNPREWLIDIFEDMLVRFKEEEAKRRL